MSSPNYAAGLFDTDGLDSFWILPTSTVESEGYTAPLLRPSSTTYRMSAVARAVPALPPGKSLVARAWLEHTASLATVIQDGAPVMIQPWEKMRGGNLIASSPTREALLYGRAVLYPAHRYVRAAWQIQCTEITANGRNVVSPWTAELGLWVQAI